MSDLTKFRDHCREMAGPPVAPGCHAAADRALWLRLAFEIDAYLNPPTASVDLFGDVTTEPPMHEPESEPEEAS